MKHLRLFESFNYDSIISDLSKIDEPYISVPDMFKSQEVKDDVDFEEISYYNIGDGTDMEDNTYYHVNTDNTQFGGGEYAGVGHGLYLGRDKEHLLRYYDMQSNGYSVNTYKGEPKWFNVMKGDNFSAFKQAFSHQGIDIVNSKEVGEVITKMGYDGVRYWDTMATGEEFVLFNQDKLKQV